MTTFDYKKPDEAATTRIEKIRHLFNELSKELFGHADGPNLEPQPGKLVNKGRNASIAFTTLEDACMRAVKSVVEGE